MSNRVVAFLPGYATSHTRRFDIESIPGDRITDLVYCFAGFRQQGQDWVADFPEPHDADPQQTTSNIAYLVKLKQKWPRLNIMIGIGGWTHSHQGDPTYKTTPVFSAIAATPKARATFVKSCLDLFIRPLHAGIGHLFAGIDIDWEFPSPADRHPLTLLLQEFRNELDAEGKAQGRHLTLSASSGVDSAELELASLKTTLDWVNLMTYIAHSPNKTSPQNKFTDFNSPLFASPAEPSSNATWNIDTVVNSFIATGFPAGKLVLGINAYARTYAGVPNVRHGVYQTYTGPGPGSLGKPGILAYKDLMSSYLPKYESHWDGVTQSAYLYDHNEQVWMSFDSVHSIKAKGEYVREKKLGGMMLWELSADAPSSEGHVPPPKHPALIDAMAQEVLSSS